MQFRAIDIETANANMRSICQIGIATFDGADIIHEWKSYVDPKEHFDFINVGIHGIDQSAVKGAPTLKELYPFISKLLSNQIVVHHMPFDRAALRQATDYHKKAPLACRWLDSAKVARRTWSEISKSGYNLKNVCKMIGYEFKHHDALEDAKAAGQVVLAAQHETGLDLDGWLSRIEQSITPRTYSPSEKFEANPHGPFYGEVIVFTGGLQILRSEAEKIAADIGMTIGKSVTKKTTIVCLGDVDISQLNGHEKTSKHRKAEEAIQKGQSLRIIGETDFFDMLEYSS